MCLQRALDIALKNLLEYVMVSFDGGQQKLSGDANLSQCRCGMKTVFIDTVSADRYVTFTLY